MKEYTFLYAVFGSHSAAAKFLGFTPEHYRALRHNRANMSEKTLTFIRLKTEELRRSIAQTQAKGAADAR